MSEPIPLASKNKEMYKNIFWLVSSMNRKRNGIETMENNAGKIILLIVIIS